MGAPKCVVWACAKSYFSVVDDQKHNPGVNV